MDNISGSGKDASQSFGQSARTAVLEYSGAWFTNYLCDTINKIAIFLEKVISALTQG